MGLFVSPNLGFHSAVQETARCIKNAGFDGLFFNANEGILTSSDVNYIKSIGLTFEALHLPYRTKSVLINDLWECNANTTLCITELCRFVKFAHDCNIPTVVMHSSNGYHPPTITNDGLKNFVTIAKYCQKADVKLVIENIKRPDYVFALLHALDCFNVGFCFDVGHANAFSNDLYADYWNIALKNFRVFIFTIMTEYPICI